MNKNNQAYVGLDIGSTHVLCVIAVAEPDSPAPSIIGVGRSKNTGMRKGVVVDVDETASAITLAVDEAERISGITVSGATVGIDGSHLKSLNSKGVIAVGGVDREITVSDIDRVNEAATVVQLPPNREIIQVFPRIYRLDGQEDIKDPTGMSGVRLEVDAHIITGSTPAIRNLDKTVEQLDIAVHEHVPVALAAARCVLSKKDREAGTVLVDIGGSTTNLAVFEEGEVLHTATIPIGGDHLTNDLAIGLKTDLDTAETVKFEHLAAKSSTAKQKEKVTIKQSDKTELEFTNRDINMIAKARLKEIMQLIDKELARVNKSGKLPGGAVLTGGGSRLIGIVDFTKDALGLPARLAKPTGFTGIIDNIDGPQFATAVGLMLEDIYINSSDENWKHNIDRAGKGIVKFFKRFKP